MAKTTGAILHLIFIFIWLFAVTAHLILLRLLCTGRERTKLRLPPGAWPFLLSITVVDLAALLFGTTAFVRLNDTLLVAFEHWPLGVLFCRLISFLKAFALTVTNYSLLALLVLCYRLTVKQHRPPTSKAKQALLVGVIWVVALITTLPLLVFYSINEVESVKKCSFNELISSDLAGFLVLNIFQLQIVFPLPVLLFLFFKLAATHMYNSRYPKENLEKVSKQWWIMKKLAKKNDQTQQKNGSMQEEMAIMSPHDIKFVRMILILSVVCYLLSWPAFLNNIAKTWNLLEYFFWFILFAETPYYFKPFLYLLLNSNFWFALRTMGSEVNTSHISNSTPDNNTNRKAFNNSSLNENCKEKETTA